RVHAEREGRARSWRARRSREQTHHAGRVQGLRHTLMDVGIRSPFLDFFRRGEVAKDVRMLAARGALAPRAHEQIALLVMLTEDADQEIRGTAESTLGQISHESLAAFLGRSDVPEALREFFRGRGIEPDLA